MGLFGNKKKVEISDPREKRNIQEELHAAQAHKLDTDIRIKQIELQLQLFKRRG